MNYKEPFKFWRRRLRMGPGGWNCACCGPAPKWRKKYRRLSKRRERVAVKLAIQNIL